jgi:hypothetical protein
MWLSVIGGISGGNSAQIALLAANGFNFYIGNNNKVVPHQRIILLVLVH